MGLVAHYKLDGDANDALSNNVATAIGSVSYTDGKLGQAFSTGSATGELNTSITDDVFKSAMSASAWVKVKQWGLAQGVFGTRAGGNGWMLYRNAGDAAGVMRFYMHCTTTTDADSRPSHNVTFPTNEWFHVVVTRGNGWFSTWLNGVRVGHTEMGSTFLNWNTDGTSLRIGSGGTGWRTQQMDIDDVRIYDHALSEREVRDLAKGLVLHYDFDQFQEPTENLVNTHTALWGNWSGFTGSSAEFSENGIVGVKLTGTASGGVGWATTNTVVASPSTTYAVSSLMKWQGTYPATNYFYLRQYRADGTQINEQGLFNQTGLAADTWHHVSRVFTTHAECTSFVIQAYQYTAPCVIWRGDIQIEQKPYATPFVNGTRQGTVRDSSTQGNDAPLTLANTPRWVEGGAVGKGCYEFNSNSINCGNSFNTTEDQTISIWVRPYNFSARRNFYNRAYGGEGTITQETNGALNYYWGTHGGNSSPFQAFNSVTPLVLNRWNHVCLVRKLGANGYLRWYINGVQTATTTPAYAASAKSTANLLLGTGYTTFFNGMLDDLRIYTTALSADEVKELYQQRASLDSRGNLIC